MLFIPILHLLYVDFEFLLKIAVFWFFGFFGFFGFSGENFKNFFGFRRKKNSEKMETLRVSGGE